MPSVIVAGGGLAGLAAAAALAGEGFSVQVFEARPFLGGRATSYPHVSADGESETIDNCQHVLLRCCVNLIDLYRRLGVAERIAYHREFFFLEPGGRMSRLRAGMLPAPLHFTESFAGMRCLTLGDKMSLAKGLLTLRHERTSRGDLDSITMAQWLEEKRQTPQAIERFWKQVLVSAINEDLDRMAAVHGFQVFWLGFLASSQGYEMGVPAVPLGELYGEESWKRFPNVRFHFRCPVESIDPDGVVAGGSRFQADYYVSCLPFERVATVVPGLPAPPAMDHSPITGIHLWFDRPVTELPHAVLLDRTVQWMFNKNGGSYLQLVVSASRSLVPKGRGEVVDLALAELSEFLPSVSKAKLTKAHVVKELRATFSARPGLEAERPGNRTQWPNVFLAGDWTRSGWPATMEGAVRSGYLAAEAICAAAGQPKMHCLPDIA
ncbi:MAG TPA: hydroxysqualene dehydroxylase HpnE [Bryobacteraceae bacterium]|nr:hydroxysqualene dehydroxylase HpnE [Bryobacteraceae bacterium]